MSVDLAFAMAQARRLRFCKYFPAQDAEAYFVEAGRVLRRAKNDIVAAMVVDEWMDEEAERPTMADLNRAVARHNGLQSEPVIERGEQPTAQELAEHAEWVKEMEAKMGARKLRGGTDLVKLA